jgi:hypothetical protein
MTRHQRRSQRTSPRDPQTLTRQRQGGYGGSPHTEGTDGNGGVDDAVGIVDRAAVSQGEAQADHDVVADGLHLGSYCTRCHQWYQAGFRIPAQLYSFSGCHAHDVDRVGMQSESLVLLAVVCVRRLTRI